MECVAVRCRGRTSKTVNCFECSIIHSLFQLAIGERRESIPVKVDTLFLRAFFAFSIFFLINYSRRVSLEVNCPWRDKKKHAHTANDESNNSCLETISALQMTSFAWAFSHSRPVFGLEILKNETINSAPAHMQSSIVNIQVHRVENLWLDSNAVDECASIALNANTSGKRIEKNSVKNILMVLNVDFIYDCSHFCDSRVLPIENEASREKRVHTPNRRTRNVINYSCWTRRREINGVFFLAHFLRGGFCHYLVCFLSMREKKSRRRWDKKLNSTRAKESKQRSN